jgi:hypothetical protein
MTLTLGGWIFLIVAWTIIGGGAGWCMYQVLFAVERNRRRKDETGTIITP